MARPRRTTYHCLACAWTAWAGHRTRLICGGCGAPMRPRREALAAAAEVTENKALDPVQTAIEVLLKADRAAVRDALWEAGLTE